MSKTKTRNEAITIYRKQYRIVKSNNLFSKVNIIVYFGGNNNIFAGCNS